MTEIRKSDIKFSQSLTLCCKVERIHGDLSNILVLKLTQEFFSNAKKESHASGNARLP